MPKLAGVLIVALVASLFGPPRAAAAAGCGMPGVATTTVYLPNITKTLGGPGGWVTPFIVQNVGTAATTLEVSFYGFYDGALVSCRSVPSLLPGTSFADVPNNDADLPDNAQFAVVVRSFGSQVVAVVNEQQGIGARAEAMSYGGLSAGATTVVLPWLSKGMGGWLTTFVVQNVGTLTAGVTIAMQSLDGARNVTLARTIAPGRSTAIDPTVEAAIAQNDELSATVTSTQPIAVVVNAHNDAAGVAAPRAFSYNGITGAGPTTYVPYLLKEDLEAFGPGASHVYLQNAGATDAVPTLTFRQLGTGTTITIAAPAPVKPGATWAFDPQIYKIAGGYQLCRNAPVGKCISPGEHALVVTGGSFAVVNAAITATTAMGSIGSSTAGTRYYLPNITKTLGGASGWTTPIVLQSAGATSATLRWYRFADGALAVTQYIPSLVPGGSVRVDPRTVTGLADATQYAVVVDAPGPVAAVVQELSFQGGDGTMAYEGFAATAALTPAPVPSSIAVSPATAAVGLSASQQLTATVRDQSGNAFTGVPVTWSVSPASAGTVSATGLFTAGAVAGTATVTATFGTLSGSAVLTLQAQSLSVGGFTFAIRSTSTSDVYVEQSISSTDATTVATTVDGDVADVQTTYGRPYTSRPALYVFPTTTAYTTGLQSVLGLSATEAAVSGAQTSGFTRWSSVGGVVTTKLALNWQRVQTEKPMTTARHELTHMMIDQIVKPTSSSAIPAWINEGSARLEEFTIAGTGHWKNQNRYGAASMVAVRSYFTLADLTSQTTWNARTGDQGIYQYYEASQIVQLLRNDVGVAGVVRIFDLMGQGQVFDAAFQSVTGRTSAAFGADIASRLQAISAVYPYLVTSTDEPGGTGLSYVLYGFQPVSTVTFDIKSQNTGYQNTNKTRTVDAYGVSTGYLGTTWPADTYTFTATGLTPPSSSTPGISVTFTVTAVKTASFVDPALVP